MMKLYVTNSHAFLWDAKDVYCLRKDHHIVGSLVGCYPHKSFQNLYKWLPLQLLPEEATLLVEKGIAELLLSPKRVPNSEIIHTYFEKKDKLCNEQIALLRENRQKTIQEKANEIYEGKKRKYIQMLSEEKVETNDKGITSSHNNEQHGSEELEKEIGNRDYENSSTSLSSSEHDNDDTPLSQMLLENEKISEKSESFIIDEDDLKKKIIDAELSKVPLLKKELCMVQQFTECSWKSSVETVQCHWKFPSNNAEKLRYAVFKDLWEKGYYLTAGAKFGGDFLVYEGDPLKYHALYIVICMPYNRDFQAIDLVRYGRLSNQVKKTAVLASLMNGIVEYISLKWLPDLY